ncbi:hypothetical protein H4Q32_007550 [Labeo rohita]|uniref:DUF5641 domain-containing protein n=1 Tax=Labeo rohita TaxID=84645 RepID=A0ABQ8MGT2_LABRO|nr:hypothetical protein H4Q32_007550 [Labeo rohita]
MPQRASQRNNGSNFVSSNHELSQALKELNQNKIPNSLAQEGIKWTFNPPLGAHQGGVWERLVQAVKRMLCSVVRQQVLDDESLLTVLCEVKAILNDRPIMLSLDDPNDLEALTPNHILQLRSNPVLPRGLFKRVDLHIRRCWRQVQYMVDLFWKRWTREYLVLMQKRQKWSKTCRNLNEGDLVLVMDENAPRNSWHLGRVTKAISDSKGLVRRVCVKTRASELDRPVNKLSLLIEGI